MQGYCAGSNKFSWIFCSVDDEGSEPLLEVLLVVDESGASDFVGDLIYCAPHLLEDVPQLLERILDICMNDEARLVLLIRPGTRLEVCLELLRGGVL